MIASLPPPAAPAVATPPAAMPPAPPPASPTLSLLQPVAWGFAARVVQGGFDSLRLQHAAAVRAGVIPASLRGSARFEQWVDALEKSTLGPLARRV